MADGLVLWAGFAAALAALGDPEPDAFGAQLPADQIKQAWACRTAAIQYFVVDGYRFEALGRQDMPSGVAVWLAVGPPDEPRRHRVACTYFSGQTEPGMLAIPPLSERQPSPR
jgi:hypothetical protein